jgi:hypothetical protein
MDNDVIKYLQLYPIRTNILTTRYDVAGRVMAQSLKDMLITVRCLLVLPMQLLERKQALALSLVVMN